MDIAFLMMLALLTMLARSTDRDATLSRNLPLFLGSVPATSDTPPSDILRVVLRNPSAVRKSGEPSVEFLAIDGASLHDPLPLRLDEEAARSAQVEERVFQQPVRAAVADTLTGGGWNGQQVLLEIDRDVSFVFVDQTVRATLDAAGEAHGGTVQVAYRVALTDRSP